MLWLGSYKGGWGVMHSGSRGDGGLGIWTVRFCFEFSFISYKTFEIHIKTLKLGLENCCAVKWNSLAWRT